MDKYEQRRKALANLVENLGRGGISKIAVMIGKEANYVSRMLYPEGKAGRKRIGEDSVDALDQAFPGWHKAASNGEYIPKHKTTSSSDIVTIKQFDVGGRMGNNGLVLSQQPGVIKKWEVTKEWLNQNLRGFSPNSQLVVVTGFGDSMVPMYKPGDPLLVDISVTRIDFDGVYFFRVGNEGFIKRLQRIPGVGIRAISDNRDHYDPWTITKEMDFAVIGRVLKAWIGSDY